MSVRLQKFLADAGIASRRAGERMILAGRVEVNGKVVTELGTKIEPGHDRVKADGVVIKAKRKLYLAVNKPKGYLCTRSDPEKRRTIGDLLPKEWSNLYTVGRLDKDSEGLIFMTNDGDFSLKLTHPRFGITKKYIVRVNGRVEEPLLEQLLKGVYHDGERLRASKATILNANNSHSNLELELREGKYREIRRMCIVLNLTVDRLVRVQIGKIKLGDLPEGRWRTLTEPEIKSLLSAS